MYQIKEVDFFLNLTNPQDVVGFFWPKLTGNLTDILRSVPLFARTQNHLRKDWLQAEIETTNCKHQNNDFF